MALSKNSSKDLVKCSRQLTTRIHLWSRKRLETVAALRRLADELMKHHTNVHIAKVSGSSFSISGFVLIATGFGLSAASFGTSLILSAVGGAMCAGGGVTAAGSGIVGNKIFKSKLAEAQKIIEADWEAQQPVEELLNELYREVSKVSFGSLKDHLSCNASVVSLVKNLVDVGKCAKAGTRIATTTASEGVEGMLRSIGIAGNAARIGLFTVSAIFLPLDIYTVVSSAMEIDSARKGNKNKEPEAVKKLKRLADELEKEMVKMLQAVYDFAI